MTLNIRQTKSFKKDVKRAKKQNRNLKKLAKVIRILAAEEILPKQYRDHQLSGNFVEARECHIAPDWLLIYKINKNQDILYLIRVGSHSDLF